MRRQWSWILKFEKNHFLGNVLDVNYYDDHHRNELLKFNYKKINFGVLVINNSSSLNYDFSENVITF